MYIDEQNQLKKKKKVTKTMSDQSCNKLTVTK